MWVIIKTITEFLSHVFPAETIGRFVSRIVAQKKLLSLLLSLLLIASVMLSYWYYQRSTSYSDIVFATLNNRVEETPQHYKGLEAFLLSSVDRRAQDLVRNAVLDADFVRVYGDLSNDLQKSEELRKSSTATSAAAPSNKTEATKAASIPNLSIIYPTGDPHTRLLSDTGVPGFLFLPLDIVRTGYAVTIDDAEQGKAVDEKVMKLISDDQPLLRDVLMTRAIAADVDQLRRQQFVSPGDSSQVIENRPSQVYLITGTGINRIFSNTQGRDEASEFYARQFFTSTFFPSRPYFQEAEKYDAKPLSSQEGTTSQSGNLLVKDYFYVSQPYLDLGGNGMVITAARPLRLYKENPAVLCLDFKFAQDKDLDSTLKSTITRFNAPSVTAKFKISSSESKSKFVMGKPDVLEPQGRALTDTESALLVHAREMIEDKDTDLASILGNIQRIDGPISGQKTAASGQGADQKSEAGTANKTSPGSDMEVSVPMGATFEGKDIEYVTLLLFRLDLAAYRANTDIIGLAGCTCLAVFSILLIAAIVIATNRNEDLQKATIELQTTLDRIGEVMEDAPVPYTLLSATDSIVNCNLAMAEFLGISAHDLVGRHLRSLIATSDQHTYDSVQDRRAKGLPVDPYPLHFQGSIGLTKEVWIVSAAVPTFDEVARPTLPQTFGIMLLHKPSTKLTVMEPNKRVG